MSKEIEVVWKDGQRGSWCQAIVEYLTQGFAHRMDTVEDRVRGEGAIVVVKADQIKSMAELNQYVHSLKWLLLIVTANEDANWKGEQFHHPNSLVWLQTPHKTQHAHRFLPWGWTPGCAVEVHSKKVHDWFFAGQDTHRRRHECIESLGPLIHRGHYIATLGFGNGLPQADYYRAMGNAKVIPCPSGPVTVDSLRVCEALQLGAVPVVDGQSPTGPYPEYWDRVFGADFPFPLIEEWSEFPDRLQGILERWAIWASHTSVWWQRYKARLHAQMMLDLRELGAP